MSEIIKERLRESLGKVILVFTLNNFRFEGKLTNIDETYLEMLDFKTNSYKIIELNQIKDMEVRR